MEPLVSVIVACYNGEKYIDLCIESLVNQTYKNIEIIVCDDASKDKSLEKLEWWKNQDSRIVILHNEKSLKAAASRNRCIEITKGEYIVIQDIDDYSELNRIELLLKYLHDNADIDFISSASYMFSENERQADSILKIDKKYPVAKDFLWGLPFVHAATMFKRNCIMAVSGYRVAEETKRGQDYDMFMRMYAAGYKGMNCDEKLYWVRADRDFLMRRVSSSLKDEYRVRLRGFKQLELMPIGYLFALKPYVAEVYHKMKARIRRGNGMATIRHRRK